MDYARIRPRDRPAARAIVDYLFECGILPKIITEYELLTRYDDQPEIVGIGTNLDDLIEVSEVFGEPSLARRNKIFNKHLRGAIVGGLDGERLKYQENPLFARYTISHKLLRANISLVYEKAGEVFQEIEKITGHTLDTYLDLEHDFGSQRRMRLIVGKDC